MKSNFERMSLRNIESFQWIISSVQVLILEVVEDNSYLEKEVKIQESTA